MILRRVARPLLATIFVSEGIESLRDPGSRVEAAEPVIDLVAEAARPGAQKLAAATSDAVESATTAVDERGEIAVMFQGIPQMALGSHTDVLDACPKALGIPILLRSANPQVIAVAEITVREDLMAMSAAANCGVRFLATIHAADRRELGRRPLFSHLLKEKVFEKLVTIRREEGQRQYLVEELW